MSLIILFLVFLLEEKMCLKKSFIKVDKNLNQYLLAFSMN